MALGLRRNKALPELCPDVGIIREVFPPDLIRKPKRPSESGGDASSPQGDGGTRLHFFQWRHQHCRHAVIIR